METVAQTVLREVGNGDTIMDHCKCEGSGELGIALSGGGARALAQLGVLKVLEREAVPISYVAGTSAGAVIGAVYVTTPSAVEAEERILTHLRTTGTGFNAETFGALVSASADGTVGLLDIGRTLWRARGPSRGLVGGDAMRASLRVLLGESTCSDGRLPFAATALDLVSGRRMIFGDGPLVDAVYASSAIPGLFEPLELEGYLLVDGGWAEPVPVNTCRHLGAIHTLAVDVPTVPAQEPGSGALPSALRADALARELLEELQLREADFVLRPEVTVRHFADFSDAEGLIAAGARAAEAALAEITGVLERHRSLFVRTRHVA